MNLRKMSLILKMIAAVSWVFFSSIEIFMKFRVLLV